MDNSLECLVEETTSNENIFITHQESGIVPNNENSKEVSNLQLTNVEKIKEETMDEMEIEIESEVSLFENNVSEKEKEGQIFVKNEIIGELQNSELAEFESTANPRENNHVYQILMSEAEGEFQLAAYDFEDDPKNYQQLLDKKRTTYFNKNKVAKKIIFYEFRRNNSFQISSKRMLELAKSAAECFPRIKESSFYHCTSHSKTSGGALNTFYLKQREKEIAIGRCKSMCTKRKRIEGKKNQESEESESEDLKQLQEVVEVDEAYKLKWRKTAFKERIGFYEKSSIDKILSKFPILMGPAGASLIESDYSVLINRPDKFYENWSAIAPKVIALAKRKAKKKDESINILLKENGLYEEKKFENLDDKLTVALILLPFLFKRLTKQHMKHKNPWKPTNEEVTKGFIYHTKETENLDKEISRIREELKNIHESHKIELRPYVVISGPTLNKITSAHVIVGNWAYETSSTMKAVDLCFKCTKLFQKPYSILSNHVWQFLEVAVYKMQTNAYSSVNSIIESLDTV